MKYLKKYEQINESFHDIMECIDAKEKITKTFNEVNDFSKIRKVKELDEEMIDQMLDRISIQNEITETANRISQLNEGFSKLSWFTDLDEECLALMRSLLDLSKESNLDFRKYYAYLNRSIKRRYATKAMNRLHEEIDNWHEYNEDLEDLFFNLPEDKDFTKHINLLSR